MCLTSMACFGLVVTGLLALVAVTYSMLLLLSISMLLPVLAFSAVL